MTMRPPGRMTVEPAHQVGCRPTLAASHGNRDAVAWALLRPGKVAIGTALHALDRDAGATDPFCCGRNFLDQIVNLHCPVRRAVMIDSSLKEKAIGTRRENINPSANRNRDQQEGGDVG